MKQSNITITWNVDTQYDFMRPNGRLYVPESETLEPTLEQLTQLFRKKNITIVNSADWHNPDSKELSDKPDFITTFPIHCMQNTHGATYVPATQPNNPYIVDWQASAPDLQAVAAAKEIVIYKDLFDVFAGNPHTDAVVNTLDPQRVIVYGIATNVCVDYAVQGLLDRGLEVYVVQDAIKGLPLIPSPVAIWKEKGVHFVKADQVTDYL